MVFHHGDMTFCSSLGCGRLKWWKLAVSYSVSLVEKASIIGRCFLPFSILFIYIMGTFSTRSSCCFMAEHPCIHYFAVPSSLKFTTLSNCCQVSKEEVGMFIFKLWKNRCWSSAHLRTSKCWSIWYYIYVIIILYIYFFFFDPKLQVCKLLNSPFRERNTLSHHIQKGRSIQGPWLHRDNGYLQRIMSRSDW